MKQTYEVTKQTDILIYGAGTLGLQYEEKLCNAGFYVAGFLDQNANKISVKGKHVFPPETSRLKKKQEEYVVIIVVHNALWHGEISDNLAEKGFKKILFLPTKQYIKPIWKEVLLQKYAAFMDERFDKLTGLPCIDIVSSYELTDLECLISKNESYATVWINMGILFSEELRKEEYDRVKSSKKYTDVPIGAMDAHLKLFSFFKYGYASPDEYLDIYTTIHNRQNDYGKKEFLKDRYNLYLMLKQKLSRGTEYFTKNPVYVKWNERGYFNIFDGHHRAVFFYHENMRYLPVRMSLNDYEKWGAVEKSRGFFDYIEQNKIMKAAVPIMNPYFMGVEAKYEIENDNMWDKLYKIVRRNKIALDYVLEISDYNGYFARNLRRVGAEFVEQVAMNEDEYSMICQLNCLYGMEQEIHLYKNLSEIEEIKHYSIFVAAHILSDYMGEPEISELLKKTDVVFWESGAETEQEKDYILNCNKSFKYIKTNMSYNGNYVSEAGVFYNGKMFYTFE